jgi:predicted transcriptional regulator of viral defense system
VYLGAEIEQHPLAESASIAMKFPRAVLGLATALEFHRLTTSWADGTWILVPRDRNPPHEDGVHVVRVMPALLDDDLGISTLEVHGVQVKITSPVRTVLDCWKYTRRVSHTLAVEALRALRASEGWNGVEVLRIAKAVGVWSRIWPFVEALG